MTNLEWALKYASLGWPIVPLHYVLANGQCSCRQAKCDRIGKHPVGTLVKEGLKEASTDSKVIEKWWSHSPYFNIGYATGGDGHIVMDVDAGGDKVGPATLKTLETTNGELPRTLLAKTGGGGFHYHFLTPLPIKNSQEQVGRSLDVRARGGYVILPPSNHASGNKYEWLTDLGQPIAELPEWLGKRMASKTIKGDFAKDTIQPEIVADAKEGDRKKFTPEQITLLLSHIPADCDRDTWYRIGAALKTELGDEAGWEAWKGWSSAYVDEKHGWNEQTGRINWDSFVDGVISGGTLFFYAKQNGFQAFKKEKKPLPEIEDKWIWVATTKRFVDCSNMDEWDSQQYNGIMYPLYEKGNPSELALRCGMKQVKHCTYWPKQELIVEEHGIEKLNMWKGHDLEPSEEDAGPLVNHVRYLYPNLDEARILLDYLAFQVQQPGEKVHWALLMQGVQGTGKSYFGLLLRLILGEHNVASVTNEMLHEPYTGWIRNKQFVVVEEMMAGRRLELMNKLKAMITEEWLQIREMYMPPYKQSNRVNFLFLTNHSDPIIIDSSDRRYCVLASSVPPNPAADYYKHLFDWTRENPAAILGYLLRRDLSRFDSKAHAPMTEGKAAMIHESLNDLEHSIRNLVETSSYPFHADISIASDVPEILGKTGLKCNIKTIERAFGKLGYIKLGSCWAVRNVNQFKGMSKEQIDGLVKAMRTGVPVEGTAPIFNMTKASKIM